MNERVGAPAALHGTAIDCAIFMLDPNGKVANWNAGAASFHGIAASDIIGCDYSRFFTPNDAAQGRAQSELAIVAKQGWYAGEGWRVRHCGTKYWASIALTAMHDRDGALLGFCIVTRDISASALGTAQFRVAVEAAPTGMIMVDASGKIMLVNGQIEKLFGYSRHELIDQAVEMLVPERFRAAHPATRNGFFSAPHARPMGSGRDLYGLRKDGREVPIEIGLNPLQTPEGTFVLSSVVDITERKRATEQFRLAIEAAPNGMIMVDQEGHIVLVNAHVEALFGYAREELIGHSVDMLVPDRIRAHHPQLRHGFADAPRARPMGAGRDLRGLRKDGEEIPIEIALNPLQTSEGEFVLCSVADITERIHAQTEREALAERRAKIVEMSATLKERETLLQEIHHRVKNNLQVVSSLINIQLSRTEDENSRNSLGECASRVQAIALIHAMLYQTQDYLHIPFSEYAHRLAANVFSAAGATSGTDRITLELEIDDVELHVDKAVPCGLILNELITNALKHGFPDGRSGVVRVQLRVAAVDRLSLVVSDNGVGMPADLDLRAVKSVGMQLVRSLAKQLRSQLDYEHGEWTCFKLEFSSKV
jgi:PAS domain S-box-containing protein